MEQKTIIISVVSDLVTDQRVHRTAITFTKQGLRVVLVGRKMKNSMSMGSRRYRAVRFKLWFEKGALFYANYNIRLFFYLMFNKSDILFSNDLDTLLANYLVSVIKRKRLIYDSHEYFTGVPELENNSVARKVWKGIERFIFPRLKDIITVNDSIAGIYEKEYGKKVHVVRNIPEMPLVMDDNEKEKLMAERGIDPCMKIIIMQGSGINIDRGAEEAVEAMRFVDNAVLLIVGGGDVMHILNDLVKKFELQKKVMFIDKMPYDKLLRYTRSADIGLTLDKDTNLNYRFSLPNKLFDYIHANVPVLASSVVEVKKIIEKYDIGVMIENHNPIHIAEKINCMLADENRIKTLKQNLEVASRELNWSSEEKKLLEILYGSQR